MSSQFTIPPLDGSLSTIQIFDFHLEHSPDYPLLRYQTSSSARRQLTWRAVVSAIHGTATMLLGEIDVGAAARASTTIGVLAVSDSVSYITQMFGIMRAGFVPFPISTRNSCAAVCHLLTKTRTKYLYVSQDNGMLALVATVLQNLGDHTVHVFAMPAFEDLYDPADGGARNRHLLPPMITPDWSFPSIVLHSSGTTSFPKPITYTHLDLLQFAKLQSTGEFGLPGHVHAMHFTPMFHAMGVTSLIRAAAIATTIAMFEPRWPPLLPSADELLRGIVNDECTIVPCVPSFLETWSSDPKAVNVLVNLKAVIFAGGPLGRAVGDSLVAKGVPLYSVYGGTEFGTVSMMLPEIPLGENWQYFKFASYFDPHLTPWEEADVFELYALETAAYTPIVVTDIIHGRKAYATQDLLERHPTDPTLWRVYGRCDDQIMLSTGEKTNPGPIESIFCKDDRILGAIMFGRSKPQNGIILELKEQFRFDISDHIKLAAFRDSISNLVAEANDFAPSHSRLYEEMVLVADPTKAFEYTPKGAPRRHSILDAHRAEIESAYASSEQASASNAVAPAAWDFVSTLRWTLNILQRVLSQPVQAHDDVFHLGCDSLRAIRIRNIFASVLRKSMSTFEQVMLSLDFVYRHPTAQEMALYLVNIIGDDSAPTPMPPYAWPSKLQEMEDLVKRMSATSNELNVHKPPSSSSDVVLLTGTTGALGSHLLNHLCDCDDVKRIYALNRGDKGDMDNLRRRQKDTLVVRGIRPSILQTGKVVLISGDLTMPGWNLDPDLFDELGRTVTLIIHAAWPVDFNYTLTSFTGALRGLRSLINFAFWTSGAGTPRILYTSSVSVVKNWLEIDSVSEVAFPDPSLAVGLGYAESKWVAERMLDNAAERGLQVSIIRMAQLSGSPNGTWSTNEWFPSVVQSGPVLGCLPDFETKFAWLPVDVAAQAIVDLKCSDKRYIHLAHPNPISSAMVIEHISNELNVPLVPFQEWFERAKKASERMAEESPALVTPLMMIINFFFVEGRIGNQNAFRDQSLCLENALSGSPALSSIVQEPLGRVDISRWLSYWGVSKQTSAVHAGPEGKKRLARAASNTKT
ncbi:acetyl-CoA synthetase-like protein [Hygrophoropsis aurantiaca]|uniref:Acetyl-CoA synthetase-like protein n=1 Tax=Hygrophoropsis aurantiaca TaxID=72124 RepID=A0ACB8ANM9_9AGAM|nr:acetyl-CoA synthetase-like protein [Hygrophoropsis aurantiaca]